MSKITIEGHTTSPHKFYCVYIDRGGWESLDPPFCQTDSKENAEIIKQALESYYETQKGR